MAHRICLRIYLLLGYNPLRTDSGNAGCRCCSLLSELSLYVLGYQLHIQLGPLVSDCLQVTGTFSSIFNLFFVV